MLRRHRGEARMKVLTAAQMREADRLTSERCIPSIGFDGERWTAIAEFRRKFVDITSRRILVLCGEITAVRHGSQGC